MRCPCHRRIHRQLAEHQWQHLARVERRHRSRRRVVWHRLWTAQKRFRQRDGVALVLGILEIDMHRETLVIDEVVQPLDVAVTIRGEQRDQGWARARGVVAITRW